MQVEEVQANESVLRLRLSIEACVVQEVTPREISIVFIPQEKLCAASFEQPLAGEVGWGAHITNGLCFRVEGGIPARCGSNRKNSFIYQAGSSHIARGNTL